MCIQTIKFFPWGGFQKHRTEDVLQHLILIHCNTVNASDRQLLSCEHCLFKHLCTTEKTFLFLGFCKYMYFLKNI